MEEKEMKKVNYPIIIGVIVLVVVVGIGGFYLGTQKGDKEVTEEKTNFTETKEVKLYEIVNGKARMELEVPEKLKEINTEINQKLKDLKNEEIFDDEDMDVPDDYLVECEGEVFISRFVEEFQDTVIIHGVYVYGSEDGVEYATAEVRGQIKKGKYILEELQNIVNYDGLVDYDYMDQKLKDYNLFEKLCQ